VAPGGPVFLEKTNLKIGYVPMIPSLMFRPNPVSPEGHFESPNFSPFPTVGPAVVGTLKSKTGQVLLGAYAANKKDSLSASFGAEKDLNFGPLKSTGFAGYVGNSKSKLSRAKGLVAKLNFEPLELVGFAKQDTSGKNTYSGLACYNLAAGGIYVTGIVEKNKNTYKYVLPFSVIGMGIALYHNLLYYGVSGESSYRINNTLNSSVWNG